VGQKAAKNIIFGWQFLIAASKNVAFAFQLQ